MTNFYNAALAETGDGLQQNASNQELVPKARAKHLPICSLEAENGAGASIILLRPVSGQAAPIDAGNKMVQALKRPEPKAMASERGCRQETPHPV
ncbi:hypothetical protein ABVK25_009771 [Lepraria finkii]|uniref:Uncharacterized protein n=1 Tax=Lepraria finkii TaxID=1340010 RepID=A0ABR4AW54_9LECA